jgi:hypothetical protein
MGEGRAYPGQKRSLSCEVDFWLHSVWNMDLLSLWSFKAFAGNCGWIKRIQTAAGDRTGSHD